MAFHGLIPPSGQENRLRAPGPIANDDQAERPGAVGAIPDDAQAIVEPIPRPATSGRAPRRRWRIRFMPRWGPSIDPLTGWTGGGDPLGTIELRFVDRKSAEAYCRRAGIAFETRGAASTPHCTPRLPPVEAKPLCCWPTGPHPLCCGRYPVLTQCRAENDTETRRAS